MLVELLKRILAEGTGHMLEARNECELQCDNRQAYVSASNSEAEDKSPSASSGMKDYANNQWK